MTGRSAAVRAAVFLIQLYRHTISPLRLPTCRFTPTCSQYAVDALTEYGFVKGSWLAAVRLLKCGPWHPGGWDPIPDRDGPVDGPVDFCDRAEHRDAPVNQGKSQTSVV
ncbi:membrane protein insertion efficiency factor YidD [Mycolicibacterium parafortuitum]|uniref:Putative membrane protein insertion efficiency factor n=1 Tax=Mycolicibacterium parafortuitum TaxID=39692 RepID=A0A375YDT8_MYCPF|nr:membrane protein insertion efficiency factor YidD [Mycolicibacterium parafortuitum]ORB31174.1 membrane protein insertion efficiency factor YidD [Mycolicibacterium parafortuitum]SRX79218.1 putative hemolysin [Mycobacterium tuberculosis H37Rv] [Mycolicibacterium parafortuitum]